MIKNLKLKKVNRLTNTKLYVIIIFILVILLLVSSSLSISFIVKEANLLEKEDQYRNHISDLLQASDYLTYQVFNYVVTGKEEHLSNYIYELEVAKSREKAVENLTELGTTEKELEIINNTLTLSSELAVIELGAIEYMKNGNTEEAQNIIFGNDYTIYKNNIRLNYATLRNGVQSRVTSEAEKIKKVAIQSLILTVIIGVSTVISALMLLYNFLSLKAETDIDHLTGLQNRNRYKEKIQKLINSSNDKYGALMYLDIDNLKFVNECYGHIDGDKYIKSMGRNLRTFEKFDCVLARPSGDEFIAYIHGFNSENEVRSIVNTELGKIKNNFFKTNTQVEEKLRFSTGVSIYPTVSKELDDLLKFADYAMLDMKKNSRGEISFYDRTAYVKTIVSLSNKGYLDNFLENELVDFAMQPIVDANTFQIYGYEALMRPEINNIKSPLLLLQLAKEESKLDKVERLVFKKVLEKINDNINKLQGYKIFINSIADQVITKKEIEKYCGSNSNILKDLIIEFTEQEYVNEDILHKKTEMLRKLGAKIALDDYGAGYSNEFTLISGNYDIIKIDMKLIEDIDIDLKRQEIIKSIIKISHISNYKVLAEGVETIEQVKILRDLGVEFLQGYFFGKPDLEIKDIKESILIKLRHEL